MIRKIILIICVSILTVGCGNNSSTTNNNDLKVDSKYSYVYDTDCQCNVGEYPYMAYTKDGTYYFDINDDKQTWFVKMKDLSEELGYAREVKMFKAEPEKYKAHVGDVSTAIRVALTKRTNTPDMYEIMNVLGKEEVISRLQKCIENL